MKRIPNLSFMIAVQAATQGGAMPGAVGTPGVGKSATMLALAKEMKRELIMLLGSTMDPTDVGGMPWIIVNDSGKQMVRMVPREFVIHCQERDCLVFLDEFTSTPPQVFAALLTLIQDRRAGDTYLPDNTLIASAMNPAEIAANGNELPTAMANRMYHHKWEIDWDTIENGFMSGLEFDPPQVVALPDDWKKNIGGSAAMVRAFWAKMPSLRNDFPADRFKQQPGALAHPARWSWNWYQVRWASRPRSSSSSIATTWTSPTWRRCSTSA